MKKIYLAGPEVFLPDAVKVLEERKEICKKWGFEGLSPFDNLIPEGMEGIEKAKYIYESNKNLILKSDILLANCNPFRSALVDDGTSFEIGFGFAKGKKIYGYCTEKISLPEITKKRINTKTHKSGYEIDNDGYLVNEDFGNTINLMLEFSIIESGGDLIEGNFERAIEFILEINK